LASFIAAAAEGLEPAGGPFDVNQVDLTFSSRVDGESFRVVPLAIYI
jgi:hypothetical protein